MMANTSAIWQAAAHSTISYRSLAAKQNPLPSPISEPKILENFLDKKSGEWASMGKERREQ